MDRARTRKREKHKTIIAVLVTALTIFVAALAVSLFVINKLNRNNLFLKSILVDNNYILDMNSNYKNEGADVEYRNPGSIVYAMSQLVEAAGKIDVLHDIVELFHLSDDGFALLYLEDEEKTNHLRDTYRCHYLHEGLIADTPDGVPLYGNVEMPGGDREDAIEVPGYCDFDVIADSLFDFFQRSYNEYVAYGVCSETDEYIKAMFARCFFGLEIDFTSAVTKTVQLDVPYISQKGILPNGCESVSATMLLHYWGFDISPEAFVDDYLECEPVSIRWGCRYGPNPKLVYAGDPRSEDSGYGCFAPVIVRALNEYLSGTEYRAKNVSGMSLEMLKTEYLDRGIPVAVWATVNMEEIDRIILWQSTDGGESFMYPANEHCLVFIGYDEDGYIFADPYESNGIVHYSVDESVLAYNSLNTQAVVIVKVGG